MTPEEFTHARLSLGLTQHALADQLKRKRLAIVRFESGARRIPGVVEVVLQSLGSLSFVPLVGIVAAEDPIELILQAEQVEVPRSMMGTGDTVALRIKEGGHVGMPDLRTLLARKQPMRRYVPSSGGMPRPGSQ